MSPTREPVQAMPCGSIQVCACWKSRRGRPRSENNSTRSWSARTVRCPNMTLLPPGGSLPGEPLRLALPGRRTLRGAVVHATVRHLLEAELGVVEQDRKASQLAVARLFDDEGQRHD